MKGVSFCETSDTRTGNEQIEIIVDYPSQQTKIGTKEKVPSEVSYQEGGLVWGSLIRPDVPRHVWTKLRLDPDQASQLAQVIREVSTSAQDSKKEPVEIVADFLMQLKAHLIVNLDRRYGNILWKSLDITLVVTVPAVWSDVAKARTIEAVTKAGFNKLEFPQLKNTIMTTEPEAAAIYTINSLQGKHYKPPQGTAAATHIFEIVGDQRIFSSSFEFAIFIIQRPRRLNTSYFAKSDRVFRYCSGSQLQSRRWLHFV